MDISGNDDVGIIVFVYSGKQWTPSPSSTAYIQHNILFVSSEDPHIKSIAILG